MYDYTLFYDDCKEKFASFDEFAEACEEIDGECAIDYDNEDVTFYNFYFGCDYRQAFCEQSMNKRDDFKASAEHQIQVQLEFRRAMAFL